MSGDQSPAIWPRLDFGGEEMHSVSSPRTA